MPELAASVERHGETAVVRLRGDVVIPTAHVLYRTLRELERRRDVTRIVVDFARVGRLDSSAVAVLALAGRACAQAGRTLELEALAEHQRAAFALDPALPPPAVPRPDPPSYVEALGERALATAGSVRSLGGLVRESATEAWAVVTRRRRLPPGAVAAQLATMGADAVFIVGLLSFLLGMTIAFQGIVQLQRFGAGVFVGDMVGWSMVREFSPLITAIVLTGRTGAAIAAELGTMRVGLEIDALRAMGVSPVRFLVLPRLAALTFAGPALTLMSMFIGISGGMLVAALQMDMTPTAFWLRIVQRVELGDFLHGFLKSFAFAWIIALAGSYLGLRASGDASSVGIATTRTVVASIFFIIVVDAAFATAITAVEGPRL
jgi:phospholipid/cholesterol/gamma-HCH transport system permease protein